MASTPDELIGLYVKETAASAFEGKVKEALEKIVGLAPKDLVLPLEVLALRRYIRKANELKREGKTLTMYGYGRMRITGLTKPSQRALGQSLRPR